MKFGKQFNIHMLAYLTGLLILNFGHVTINGFNWTMQIFNGKQTTEKHISQLFLFFVELLVVLNLGE